MATTYSALYNHNLTPKFHNKERDLFIHNFYLNEQDIQLNASTTRKSTARKCVKSESVDSVFYKKNQHQDFFTGGGKTSTPLLSSTPRLRKTSSVFRNIIVESISETMEVTDVIPMEKERESLIDNNKDSNNNRYNNDMVNEIHNGGESCTKTKEYVRDPKKLYKHRKHHSDYGIVYLQVENNDDEIMGDVTGEGMVPRSASLSRSHDQVDGGGLNNLEVDDQPQNRPHSKSDSSLNSQDGSGLPGCPGRMRKSSSHVDITNTQMYKDIYADNLRQYGFLLAKQLGISKRSPDQLRRTYQKGRQKAQERRERANTSASETSRERNDSTSSSAYLSQTRDRSSTASSIASVDSNVPESTRKLSNTSVLSNSTSELRSNKYTTSLTDISNISMLEKHKKPTTTVIRRKKGNKLPRDPTKRLSAPIMDSVRISQHDNHSTYSLRRQIASLSVPDLSQSLVSSRNGADVMLGTTETGSTSNLRKLSDETSRRHKEARARQEWRMSRLKSFDGVLTQATTWMKDVKTKQKTVSEDGDPDLTQSTSTDSTELTPTDTKCEATNMVAEKRTFMILDKSDV